MNQERLTYLIRQFKAQQLSTNERIELVTMLEQIKDDGLPEQLAEAIDRESEQWTGEEPLPLDSKTLLAAIFDADRVYTEGAQVRVIESKKVSFMRRWGWAAAVIIIAGGIGIFLSKGREPKKEVTVVPTIDTIAIHPGSNKATLAVDDKVIDLSENKEGITVNKEITYSDGEKLSEAGKILQVTTPRGGQYQAVLPDGSKVWLNAASSIRFPSKFDPRLRMVYVTGEVYLEVAKNPNQPFLVNVNGTQIEVLGTSFDVNGYSNEADLKTTLIEGSVRVTSTGNSTVIKPGEQAQVTNETINVKTADINQVLAWKNGYFSFENISIQEMARQIERWYDIDIVFEGKAVDMELKGKMDRGVQLTGIVRFFEDYGFTTKLEGRTLIVTR